MSAQFVRCSVFSVQVCVPRDWTDAQITEFADQYHPCGTEHGWCIRREGDPTLNGDPERVTCSKRDGVVHVMMDA